MRTRLRPTVMGDLPKVIPSHNFVFAQKIEVNVGIRTTIRVDQKGGFRFMHKQQFRMGAGKRYI